MPVRIERSPEAAHEAMIHWLAAALLLLFLLSPESYAAGVRLPDQSASAMGMAGAFVGQADDASVVWYNPAGMTQLFSTHRMTADASYMYLTFLNRTISNSQMDDLTPDPSALNGTYGFQSHLVAVTVG